MVRGYFLPGGGTFKSFARGGGSHMATSSTILRNTEDNKNRGRMSFFMVLMGSKHASSNTSGPYKWNNLIRFISLLMNVSDIHTYTYEEGYG